jgi:hypothetical protein
VTAEERGVAKVRWVILDIDDTLLDHEGRLPEANRRAVQAVVAKGLPVVLATGRRWSACQPFHQALGLVTPAICFCGADIRRADGVQLAEARIPAARALGIVRLLDRHGVAVRVSLEEGSCWTSHPPYPRRHPLRVDSELLQRIPQNPYMMAVEGEEQVAIALEHLRREFPGELTLYPIDSHSTGRRRLLIFDCRASKEAAAEKVGKWLELKLEDAIAMGDGLVDLGLARRAGVAVAMHIAIPELKQEADLVTPPVPDGVAYALERLVLNGT